MQFRLSLNSLSSPCWSWTCSDLPASSSQVLGLQACATMPSLLVELVHFFSKHLPAPWRPQALSVKWTVMALQNGQKQCSPSWAALSVPWASRVRLCMCEIEGSWDRGWIGKYLGNAKCSWVQVPNQKIVFLDVCFLRKEDLFFIRFSEVEIPQNNHSSGSFIHCSVPASFLWSLAVW